MTVTTASFLDQLEICGLLAADELATLRDDPGLAQLDDEPLAGQLVQRGTLTSYQAAELLAGRGDALLLEKYKILEPIGAGGHGTVYKALHTVLHRMAAIKLLRRSGRDDEGKLSRFLLEARATAQLEDARIVRVYDGGRQGDVYFIAMELVPGESLAQVLQRRGRLPAGEAAAVGYQVALGLEHAFQRGIIHRDIKPSNVMVTPDGTAKILDMGLARFFDNTSGDAATLAAITGAGTVMGTVDYISPEQAVDSHTADTRSDIYSLGCTLYQCLVGQVPFPNGSVVQKLLNHRDRDPTAVAELAPDVPEPMREIVQRMMAKQPDDRFQRPADVAEALAPLCQSLTSLQALPGLSKPAESTPDSMEATIDFPLLQPTTDFSAAAQAIAPSNGKPAELPQLTAPVETPSVRRLQRWPGAKTVVAGLSLLLFIGAMLGLTFKRNKITTEDVPEPAPVEEIIQNATLTIDWQAAERIDGTVSIDGQPQALPASGNVEFSFPAGKHRVHVTRPGFEPYEQSVTVESGQVLSITPVWQPTLQSIREQALVQFENELKQSEPMRIHDPAMEGLRSKLVNLLRQNWTAVERRRALALMPRLAWPIDSLDRVRIPAYELKVASDGDAGPAANSLVMIFGDSRLTHWDRVWSLAFSPTEKLVASGSKDGTVKLWDPATGEERRTLVGHTQSVRSAVFSPDGQWLASAGEDGKAIIWEVATGAKLRTFELDSGGVFSVSFSPDGQTLAAGCADRTVKLCDVTGDLPTRLLEGHSDAVFTVEYSGDGQMLASASDDNKIKVWDAATGAELRSVQGTGAELSSMSFSPDGQVIAAGRQDGTLQLWDLFNEADPLREFESHGGVVLSVCFSADGKLVASGGDDHTIKVRDVATGNERHTLRARVEDRIYALAFSSDGRSLASAGDARMVRIWSAKTGQEQFVPPGHMDWLTSLALSPAGRLIAMGNRDGTIRIRRIGTGSDGNEHTLEGHIATVTALAFSPDGRVLASCSADGVLRLWDVTTGEERNVLEQHTAGVFTLKFSPDGRILASGSADQTIRLFDMTTGTSGHQLKGHKNWIWSLSFSADGNTLASASSDGTVKLWNVATGVEQKSLDPQMRIAYGTDFSPDGRMLAAAGISETFAVAVWDIVNLDKPRLLMLGHTESVRGLSFAADARSVATSAQDGTVRRWNVDTGELLDTLQLGPPRGRILAVSFTPEGRHLATVNGNGTIYILRLSAFAK